MRFVYIEIASDPLSLALPRRGRENKRNIFFCYHSPMSALILDGNKAAEALLESLKPLIKKLKPKLVIVQVGKEVASVSYVKKKIETCKNVGLDAEHLELPFETPIDKLFQTIEELNRDKETTGFIVQLPLPPHLSASTPLISSAIDPRKDVDGFTAYNLGKM